MAPGPPTPRAALFSGHRQGRSELETQGQLKPWPGGVGEDRPECAEAEPQAARIVRVAKRRAGGREVGRGPARGAGQKGTRASPRTGALDSRISQRSKVGMKQALELSSRQQWTDRGSRANYADYREHRHEQGRKAFAPWSQVPELMSPVSQLMKKQERCV